MTYQWIWLTETAHYWSVTYADTSEYTLLHYAGTVLSKLCKCALMKYVSIMEEKGVLPD